MGTIATYSETTLTAFDKQYGDSQFAGVMQFDGFDITRGFLLSATFRPDVSYGVVGPVFGANGSYSTDPDTGEIILSPSPVRGAAETEIEVNFSNTSITGPAAEISLSDVNSQFGLNLIALQSGHTGVAYSGEINGDVDTAQSIAGFKSGSTISIAISGTIETNASSNTTLASVDEAFAHTVVTYGEMEYTFFEINRVQGMSGGNDTLTGTSGEDFIEGQGGNDRLFGNAAADTLIGGLGNDLLDGGTGSDVMAGGLGNDTYVIDSANDRIVNEIGFSLGGGIDTVRSSISYTLSANTEALRLEGIENLNGFGNFAPETLVGNSGVNQLNGSGGNDRINGKSGNDVLIGGLGSDTLVGEAGADIFRFNATNESRVGLGSRDFINGFVHGEDRINLQPIDANTTLAGNQTFTFIGDNQFSSTAGELRFFTFGGQNLNIVEADTNGDGTADMQIFVNLTDFMVASDFIL